MNEYLFTSESVSEGHPDKVADQIYDAILRGGTWKRTDKVEALRAAAGL